MEDSIKSSSINNRRVIMEIRFDPNLDFVDRRGALLKKFKSADVIKNSHWELGFNDIKLFDTTTATNNRKLVFCDMKRISMSSSLTETNESFSHFFEKAFASFKAVFDRFDIIRIGCRIQGTYKCKSNDYSTIVTNFIKLFPDKFLLEDFNAKDFKFNLVYQNGQYNIGPINKDDNFIKTNFAYEEANSSVGFGIDTDNFMVKDKDFLDEKSIMDVYKASLSVEKRLFDNLSSL